MLTAGKITDGKWLQWQKSLDEQNRKRQVINGLSDAWAKILNYDVYEPPSVGWQQQT